MALHFLPIDLSPNKGEEKIIRRRNKSLAGELLPDTRGVNGRKRDYHGMTGTPEHQSWLSMLQRCYDPNSPRYERYGGRGIIVCERWRTSFRNFYEDMGPCNGMTLERLEGDGIYEKGNCVWATYTDQARNKSDNRYITHDGRTMLITDWARETGIILTTIQSRLDKCGWTVDRALTVRPPQKDPNSPEALRTKLYRERKKAGVKVIKGGRRPVVTDE